MNYKIEDLSMDAEIICVCRSCKKQFFIHVPWEYTAAGFSTFAVCPHCLAKDVYELYIPEGGDLN